MENMERAMIAGIVAFLRADTAITRCVLDELLKDNPKICDLVRTLLQQAQQADAKTDEKRTVPTAPGTAAGRRRRIIHSQYLNNS